MLRFQCCCFSRGVVVMSKERGIPKNAPKSAKREDERLDRKYGIKEGSKADLRKDKQVMRKYRGK